MYLTLRDRPEGGQASGRRVKQRVASTVVLLGLVSLFTDISSESVNAVLPIYLTTVLGMSVLAYGFIDGMYQGVRAVVRLVGGWIADRADHPKCESSSHATWSSTLRVSPSRVTWPVATSYLTGTQAGTDDVWELPTDGRSPPKLLIAEAWSPAVVR